MLFYRSACSLRFTVSAARPPRRGPWSVAVARVNYGPSLWPWILRHRLFLLSAAPRGVRGGTRFPWTRQGFSRGPDLKAGGGVQNGTLRGAGGDCVMAGGPEPSRVRDFCRIIGPGSQDGLTTYGLDHKSCHGPGRGGGVGREGSRGPLGTEMQP